MKNIISAITLSQRKTKVIRRILSREQKNDFVTNIHSIDRKNIGDLYCGPHHYFEVLKNSEIDIFSFNNENKEVREEFIEKVSQNSLIIGGGGLLNRGGFRRQMNLFESLAEKNKKIVLWGPGHNSKDPATFGKVMDYNVDISKFGLAGTRDFSMTGEWVPCVSCLHSVFDKVYPEEQETGVIFHKDTLEKPEILDQFKDLPSTSNSTDLQSLIEFIGSSKSIITDSYHAMYWSMLLGKKVVVVPNSSKFYDFKYKPVISTFENSRQDLKKANNYSGVLAECRDINLRFAEKVFNYLNL